MTVSLVRRKTEHPPLSAGTCLSLQLWSDPMQFGEVRQIVGAWLRLWGHGSLVDSAAMCVTELLANVHRHVRLPECELSLVNWPGGVRLSVSDTSPTLPVLTEPDWVAENGRGLFLLAHTAELWGVVPTATGKTVWVLLREDS